MGVEIEKREGESNESAMRRFSRKFMASGVPKLTRKRQYFLRKPNKRRLRQAAMRSTHVAEEYAYNVKIGKIDETVNYKTRRK